MPFVLELFNDYATAYRITASRYPRLAAHFVLATLLMAGISALYTLVPYLLRQATNALSIADAHRYPALAVILALAYGLTWTAAHAGEWLKNIYSAALLARCDAAFQQAVYARLIRVDYARLIETDPGALVSVVARGRDAFSAITFAVFWVIVPTAFQLLLSGAVLWRVTSGAFAFAFVGAMLVLFAVTWAIAKQSKHAHTEIFSASDLLSSHLVEKLNFMLDIKLNHAYAREDAALRNVLDVYVGKVSRGNARLSVLLAAQAACTGLLLTAFTVAAAMQAARHAFQVGDFVMIVGYIVALTLPFTSLAASLSDLRRNHIALRDGFGLLELPLERESANASFDRSASDVYVLEHVDVTSGGRTILRDVNMRIGRQELVVLMGPSGGGKSSLANLMLGLTQPERGMVTLYGANVRDMAIADISREVAVAPQSPLILTGTLRDNLVYGCDEPPPDSALRELVDLLELDSLERGSGGDALDRPLGIQGRALSGGERQRIALGRALARRPSVVIFDEPTSSLDAAREARIFARIRERVPTLIVITHHRSLLKIADRAYRLENGTVREFSPQP
ncbi:multidrug ABC transporter ATP-binding protein [Burkholderia singularis]|uniref:Multidrug ABC transporter ATP-binding protein n=1 Tax=Burkholderia singularis TaxID=1503053 RepID=A0A103E573_9BURK|nr:MULTISPECIES: ABC transporter ATP-binding protein [Burkholderia]AOK31582.1 multidrug ABC transporter ATP-binding protein [Burkholderia sp. Bp7605]KVE28577.1 multidrug ABC transporter ATP-binding protein [Burkholderia singularis]